jgi:hypothetical protein
MKFTILTVFVVRLRELERCERGVVWVEISNILGLQGWEREAIVGNIKDQNCRTRSGQ